MPWAKIVDRFYRPLAFPWNLLCIWNPVLVFLTNNISSRFNAGRRIVVGTVFMHRTPLLGSKGMEIYMYFYCGIRLVTICIFSVNVCSNSYRFSSLCATHSFSCIFLCPEITVQCISNFSCSHGCYGCSSVNWSCILTAFIFGVEHVQLMSLYSNIIFPWIFFLVMVIVLWHIWCLV